MRNTVWWVWIFSFLRNESGLDEWRCIGALLLWELPKFGGKGCCLGGSEFGLELSLERLAISRSPPIREDYMSEGGREVLLFFDLNQSWADNLYVLALLLSALDTGAAEPDGTRSNGRCYFSTCIWKFGLIYEKLAVSVDAGGTRPLTLSLFCHVNYIWGPGSWLVMGTNVTLLQRLWIKVGGTTRESLRDSLLSFGTG